MGWMVWMCGWTGMNKYLDKKDRMETAIILQAVALVLTWVFGSIFK